MKESLEHAYGNRLRVRVCGLLEKDDSLLLVKHRFGPEGTLWIPPGGEIQFGESARDALKREFLEETGLSVSVAEWLFNYEFINPPFHAMELFFRVRWNGGTLERGKDPEMEAQIIEEVRFVSFTEIEIMDKNILHGIFTLAGDPGKLDVLKGHLRAPTG